MEAPSINIAFVEKSVSAIKRGERGIVALILTDTTLTDDKAYMYLPGSTIPTELSEDNKGYVEMASIGYQNAPKKIIIYVMKDDTSYDAALEYMATQKWNYLAISTVETDGKAQAVATWLKDQRDNNKMTYKAVLPNCAADHEGIINVTGACVKGDTTYTAEEMCVRVAGLIAGTPLTISCTYAPLTEMNDCTRHTKADLDKAVDNGQFEFMWDGEKAKVCRGVTSFKTTTNNKGDSFKKIKLVDTMDMIRDDISMTAQDNYIGKYANSYDNKCLLLSAINAYFAGLVRDGILSFGICEINVEAQRTYFAERGGKVVVGGVEKNLEDCSDDEIKQGNTGSKVFLRATISMLDAIEDIDLEIYIG